MTRGTCHFAAAACVVVILVGLAGCGGSGPFTPPPPTPTPPPVTRVIEQDTFALGSRTLVPNTFTTTSTGTVEVTVDWTLASSDIEIFLARGTEPCTLATFNNRTCGFIATAENPAQKPERLSVPNLAAGPYTLYIANFGASAESVACQIALTTLSGASVPSLTSASIGGAGIAKGHLDRILEPRSGN